jgi:hypothetical protein
MRPVLWLLLALICSPAFAGSQQVPPLTGGPAIHLSASNLSTTPATVLAADATRGFLEIQNISANTNILACTLDGSVPAVASNGIQLAGVATGAGQIKTYDTFVPNGVVKCVGSAASTGYTVTYMQ